MSFTLYSWQHDILLLLNILEYQTLERNKKIDESDKIGILEVKNDNDILIVTLKKLYIYLYDAKPSNWNYKTFSLFDTRVTYKVIVVLFISL